MKANIKSFSLFYLNLMRFFSSNKAISLMNKCQASSFGHVYQLKSTSWYSDIKFHYSDTKNTANFWKYLINCQKRKNNENSVTNPSSQSWWMNEKWKKLTFGIIFIIKDFFFLHSLELYLTYFDCYCKTN